MNRSQALSILNKISYGDICAVFTSSSGKRRIEIERLGSDNSYNYEFRTYFHDGECWVNTKFVSLSRLEVSHCISTINTFKFPELEFVS